MKNLISALALIVLCTLIVSGCDLAKPQNQGQKEQPAAQNDPPPVEVPQSPPEQKQNVPAQNENNMVTVKAEPGMSGRGNYGTPTGNNPMEIITVPISQYFTVRDRILLMQISDAVNKFKGEHDRFPASHEEFMEKIIQANNIQLRPLPPGHEFVYESGELKVRRPAQ